MRHQVGIGKITVVVCVFLRAHIFGDTDNIIPPACLLYKCATLAQHTDLAFNFISRRATHAAEGIHIFDLNFFA